MLKVDEDEKEGKILLNNNEAHVELQERCVKNVLDIIILAMLKNKSIGLGAYDLMGLIHREFDVMVSPGMIYPKLFSLERARLIKTEWRARKKVYFLTDKGEEISEIFFDCFIDVNKRLINFIKAKNEE
jgi:DNA-binding PadR family transcriptional regulator